MQNIRNALPEELPAILSVYEHARAFMEATGNPDQWGKTNPPVEVLKEHIARKQLYVLEQEGDICGTFAFIPGTDPTYEYIEGSWHSDEEYAAIHCVAGNGKVKGIFGSIVEFCEKRSRYLRIDTYRDNHIMQHLVTKHGFVYCGVIYLNNGSPRLAYDKLT